VSVVDRMVNRQKIYIGAAVGIGVAAGVSFYLYYRHTSKKLEKKTESFV